MAYLCTPGCIIISSTNALEQQRNANFQNFKNYLEKITVRVMIKCSWVFRVRVLGYGFLGVALIY